MTNSDSKNLVVPEVEIFSYCAPEYITGKSYHELDQMGCIQYYSLRFDLITIFLICMISLSRWFWLCRLG